MKRYLRFSGIALIAGGIFLFLVNAVFTPQLDLDASYEATASSSIFLWRQRLAALVAMLLTFGSTGIYIYQFREAKLFESIAYCLAFAGSLFIFALEWNQAFFIPDLATYAPEALAHFDNREELGLIDIGSMIAISTFMLGWVLFSIAMIISKVIPSKGPSLIIAGFVMIPFLSTIIGSVWGAVVGNTILGCGFVMVGLELFKFKKNGRLKNTIQ